jgi:hypothetical protein
MINTHWISSMARWQGIVTDSALRILVSLLASGLFWFTVKHLGEL